MWEDSIVIKYWVWITKDMEQYDALILRLEAAQKMKIVNICIYEDSKLVAK